MDDLTSPRGMFMGTVGLDTGIKDKHGRAIRIGDRLRFDPDEWGGSADNEAVVEYNVEQGQLECMGVPSEWPTYCEVVGVEIDHSTDPLDRLLLQGMIDKHGRG